MKKWKLDRFTADIESGPLVSIIVAVYNIEDYIGKCVESLIKQTYITLEIILVDDGSTDNSGKVCEKYAAVDERIKVIHRENGGLSMARNTGMEIAKGEFIAFVDGDDWVDPDMYQLLVNAAVQLNAQLAACRYRGIYPDRVIDRTTDTVWVFEGTEMLKKYLEEDEACVIQHAAWNKLYRRELVEEERFPEKKWYEDVVFSAKVLGKVQTGVYLDCAKYNYVLQREGSIMSHGISDRIFTDLLPAYLEKEQYLETFPDTSIVTLHRYHYMKKMLTWYRDLSGEQKKWQGKIIEVLQAHKAVMPEVYKCPICTRNDSLRFRIFLTSPKLFQIVMNINDATILKIKKYILNSKTEGK